MSSPLDDTSSIVYFSDGYSQAGYHDYSLLVVNGYTQTGTVVGYGRRWFVKSISEKYRDSVQFREHLIKEYEILLELRDGPVAAPITLCEIEGAGLSIVMEYVDGTPLDLYLSSATNHQRDMVMERLVEALQYVHSHGFCHLDLKPEHILVGGTYSNPTVTLIDFNLSDGAAFTINKEVGGNLKYAAPEQFNEGYVAAPSADVWSLGKLMKEFAASRKWDKAISKALCEDPSMRPMDASEFLHIVAASEKTRNRKRILSLSFILLLLIVGVIFIMWHNSESNPKPDIVSENIPANDSTPPVAADTLIALSPAPIVDGPSATAGDFPRNYSGDSPINEGTITSAPTQKTITETVPLSKEGAVHPDTLKKYLFIYNSGISLARKAAETMETVSNNLTYNTDLSASYRLNRHKGEGWWQEGIEAYLIHYRRQIPKEIMQLYPKEWLTYQDPALSKERKAFEQLVREQLAYLNNELLKEQEREKEESGKEPK